jgi:hypothetical protein
LVREMGDSHVIVPLISIYTSIYGIVQLRKISRYSHAILHCPLHNALVFFANSEPSDPNKHFIVLLYIPSTCATVIKVL